MKYYQLIYDFDNDSPYINCRALLPEGETGYLLFQGKPIHGWPGIKFTYDPDEGSIKSDYTANNCGLPVVSHRFVRALEPLIGDQVQYLDLTIRSTRTGETDSSCVCMNVLVTLDAFDPKHSRYDIFELDEDDSVLVVEKYVLKKDVVRNHHIFRLKDDPIPLFVSEEVKKIIEKNHLTGFRFLQTEAK